MPISTLDPRVVAKMTPQQIADLALQAHQEAFRLRKAGQYTDARQYEEESERLASLFQRV